MGVYGKLAEKLGVSGGGSKGTQTGPRGGRYYLDASGKKVYGEPPKGSSGSKAKNKAADDPVAMAKKFSSQAHSASSAAYDPNSHHMAGKAHLLAAHLQGKAGDKAAQAKHLDAAEAHGDKSAANLPAGYVSQIKAEAVMAKAELTGKKMKGSGDIITKGAMSGHLYHGELEGKHVYSRSLEGGRGMGHTADSAYKFSDKKVH